MEETDTKAHYSQIVEIKRQRESCQHEREKRHYVQGILNKINGRFQHENHGSQKQWYDIFKVLKEKYCQLRILHLTKLFFDHGGEIKKFPDKHKLRDMPR